MYSVIIVQKRRLFYGHDNRYPINNEDPLASIKRLTESSMDYQLYSLRKMIQ